MSQIDWEQVTRKFRRYGLKRTSALLYKVALRRFCEYCRENYEVDLTPENFKEFGLKKIQDLTVDFIADNRDQLAPKYLNVIYCAVKRWCVLEEMIESAKYFKEIKFDKGSRKGEALLEAPIETKHMRTLFKIADLEDAVDVGLYGLCALRPSIIPQLRVKDIYRKNYEIDSNGKFHFTKKPAFMFIPRKYEGNKGNITFMSIIPTQLCDRIELLLNRNEKVTPDTKISRCDNQRDVYTKMKKLLSDEAVGFNGRPYLLRSYGDSILMRIERIANDRDFKEFLMGHKGKISSIYQMHGLTEEKEREYREMYVEACDNWINEHIFEQVSKEELANAKAIKEIARGLGVDEEKAMMFYKLFQKGKMTFKQYNEKITELIKSEQEKQMEKKFEQMYLKMERKHNGKT